MKPLDPIRFSCTRDPDDATYQRVTFTVLGTYPTGRRDGADGAAAFDRFAVAALAPYADGSSSRRATAFEHGNRRLSDGDGTVMSAERFGQHGWWEIRAASTSGYSEMSIRMRVPAYGFRPGCLARRDAGKRILDLCVRWLTAGRNDGLETE